MEACPYYTGFRKERLDCSQVLLVRRLFTVLYFTILYFFSPPRPTNQSLSPPPPLPGKFDTYETLRGPFSVVSPKQ